jgi:hypothetical protein
MSHPFPPFLISILITSQAEIHFNNVFFFFHQMPVCSLNPPDLHPAPPKAYYLEHLDQSLSCYSANFTIQIFCLHINLVNSQMFFLLS